MGQQQGMTVTEHTATQSTLVEQQRTHAEIQAALTISQGCPRDEVAAIEKIKNSCQRPGLAMSSRYDFSRGGNPIGGASIQLLEVIAAHWGNVQYGFRELQHQDGQSQVEAFAWDLESNVKAVRTVVIPHRMKSGGTVRDIGNDPDEIYFHVANRAQRRVRACLEEIIPRDVVEDALAICGTTASAHADITSEGLSKMVELFARVGVTQDRIERKIQGLLENIKPAQVLQMRRYYTTILDGIRPAEEIFPKAGEPNKSEAPRDLDALNNELLNSKDTKTQPPKKRKPRKKKLPAGDVAETDDKGPTAEDMQPQAEPAAEQPQGETVEIGSQVAGYVPQDVLLTRVTEPVVQQEHVDDRTSDQKLSDLTEDLEKAATPGMVGELRNSAMEFQRDGIISFEQYKHLMTVAAVRKLQLAEVPGSTGNSADASIA